jgi:hypothetical protein
LSCKGERRRRRRRRRRRAVAIIGGSIRWGWRAGKGR